MALDEDVDRAVDETSPQRDAVNALIRIKPRESGESDTDIEVKTDLADDNTVNIHTSVDIMGSIIDTDETNFEKQNFITQIVNKKERKLVSKERGSRKEIVEMTRQRDISFTDESQPRKAGFVNRFFKPAKRRV